MKKRKHIELRVVVVVVVEPEQSPGMLSIINKLQPVG
jgi:hypothetical protein